MTKTPSPRTTTRTGREIRRRSLGLPPRHYAPRKIMITSMTLAPRLLAMSEANGGRLVAVCSYCTESALLLGLDNLTHGICPECMAKETAR